MALTPNLLGQGGSNMDWWIPIVVAVITGPVVVLLQKLRSENTEQHGESRELLHHVVIKMDRIHNEIKEVNTELGNHIKEHSNGN
jgi:hypothetical protein